MALISEPQGSPDTRRQSNILVESRSHELADLFRALVGIITTNNESPLPGGSISFEALARSEQLLTTYFGALKVGLCILDTSFRYLAINPSLAEMNGIPAAEHLGKTVREVLGDFAELIEPQFNRVLDTAQPVLNLELSFMLSNRSEPGHWIEHHIPIKDATGKVVQIGVVAVEITERKRLEESLQSLSQKLKHEKRRLQAMTEVSRVLAAKFDIAQAFPKVSAHLRRVLRQEYAALAVRDEKTGQLIRQAMDFPLGKSLPISSEINATKDPRSKALSERTPLIFSASEMRGFPAGTTDYFLSEGMKALCCVPLLRHKNPLGVLVLGSTRADAFHSDDLALLNQVAAQLAVTLENAQITREVKRLRSQLGLESGYLKGEATAQLNFEEIIGESLALKEVLDRVGVVATSEATVLLLGETGTGKGLIARSIHRISNRKERPFITLNCAAIPTGLLESELFGHEKGAFTGAVSQKIGRLELADKGTLFLDEIGEIPLELQPKLLRVLQDHEFERLGGTRTIKVDLRLIAATNRELARSVAEKEFRSDLFYRLNVFPIRMPSLRERREDIPQLVRYFVRKFALAMDRDIHSIPRETMDALLNWHWPGNVRELENFVERSVILTEGAALRAPLAEFLAETSSSVEHSLEGTEREYIVRVLRETGGMISGPGGAAKRLGVKRTTLQSKMQRLGIRRIEYSGEKPD
jgi:formate hydrogenlyase transcriptional activator